jgi:glutamate transport system substrate-binding protein
MRISRVTAVAAAAALALSMAACGGNGDGTGGENPDVVESPTFEAGTTMARLSEAGKLTVGTKFDQPGFGLQGLDGDPAGFDVEIAKLIAAELGIGADDIEYV